MKWMFMAVLAAGMCCGCGDIAGRPAKTDNPAATVEVLFRDAEGYTVKRFWDKSRYHYYVVPGPAVVETSVREGKSDTPAMIRTGGKRPAMIAKDDD